MNKDALPLDKEAIDDMGDFYQGRTLGKFKSLAEAEENTEEKLNLY